jgi:hypothetical protein
MKIRKGFVTNSSSSSFIVSVNSQEAKTMVDWLKRTGIVSKIDSDALDEMIEDYEYFEAYGRANTLRALKEKDNAYEITINYYDESMYNFIRILFEEMNGLDMELDLS